MGNTTGLKPLKFATVNMNVLLIVFLIQQKSNRLRCASKIQCLLLTKKYQRYQMEI